MANRRNPAGARHGFLQNLPDLPEVGHGARHFRQGALAHFHSCVARTQRTSLRGQNPADIPGTHGKTQRNPRRNLEPARTPSESSTGPFRDPAKPLRGLPEAGQGTRHFWQEALTHLHICMAGAQRNPPEPAAEPASKMRQRRSHKQFLNPTRHPEPAGTRFGTRAFCKMPHAICQFFVSTP